MIMSPTVSDDETLAALRSYVTKEEPPTESEIAEYDRLSKMASRTRPAMMRKFAREIALELV